MVYVCAFTCFGVCAWHVCALWCQTESNLMEHVIQAGAADLLINCRKRVLMVTAGPKYSKGLKFTPAHWNFLCLLPFPKIFLTINLWLFSHFSSWATRIFCINLGFCFSIHLSFWPFVHFNEIQWIILMLLTEPLTKGPGLMIQDMWIWIHYHALINLNTTGVKKYIICMKDHKCNSLSQKYNRFTDVP